MEGVQGVTWGVDLQTLNAHVLTHTHTKYNKNIKEEVSDQ